MPRQAKTNAFKVFEVNLERASAFLRIFDAPGGRPRGQGQPSEDEKELLRGSLVFAVGALDAYLSDLVLEIVPEHAPNSPHLREALKAIAKNDPGLSLRVALAGDDRARKDEFRAALEDWLATKSFHGPEKVVMAFGYVGCSIEWDEFNQETGTDAAKELSRITDERHSIVHNGQRPYTRRALAGQSHDLIAKIAALIDREVCKLYKPRRRSSRTAS